MLAYMQVVRNLPELGVGNADGVKVVVTGQRRPRAVASPSRTAIVAASRRTAPQTTVGVTLQLMQHKARGTGARAPSV